MNECLNGMSRAAHTPLPVSVTRYVCPWCRGTGGWNSGERCMECAGVGLTDDDSPGVDLTVPDGEVPDADVPAVPVPRPPGVMKTPCVDCAFRPGSPEEGRPNADQSQPFYCHHGMHRVDDGYVAPVMAGGIPVGAMVCGGWWDTAIDGKPCPDKPFRDPGGSDRAESSPGGLS